VSLLLSIFALVAYTSAVSICDKYTPAAGTNSDLVTTVVLAVFGAVTTADTPTVPYFDGSTGNTNFITDTTAQTALAGHLVEFFGGALGCSDGSIDAYTGPDMKTVHATLGIDKAPFEYFNQQVVKVMQTSGVEYADVVTVATLLESFRSGDQVICTEADCLTSPYTVLVGDGGNFYNPPAGYSIPAGHAIQFIWGDSTHSVTQSEDDGECTPLSGGFNFGPESDTTETQTFDTAGDYYYYCSVGSHCASGMYGSITVTGSSSDTSSSSSASSSGSGSSSSSMLIPSITLFLVSAFFALF